MGKSARILGEEFGLTAQEMNQLLKNQGFLDGDPGAYFVTEIGAEFAKETDFHRGTGGYSWYNRYWTQRTWDDSIKDVLDTSTESRQAARDAISEARRIRWDQIKADRDKADMAFRSSHPDLFPAESVTNVNLSDVNRSKAGIGVLGVTGILFSVAAAGYGIYKAAPHIKKWWYEKAVPFFKSENDEE